MTDVPKGKEQEMLLDPAVKGTKNVLKSCSEVESVIGDMLTAVDEVGTKKKRRRSSSSTVTQKQKRSRQVTNTVEERKMSVITVEEDVGKKIKQDDKVETSAPPAPFAFESLCHVVNMHMSEEDSSVGVSSQGKMISSC